MAGSCDFGNLKKAEWCYRQAIPAIPKHYGPHYALATLYYEMNNLKAAARCAQVSLNRLQKMPGHYQHDRRIKKYRQELKKIISQIQGARVLCQDIFWERKDGDYNRMTQLMRRRVNPILQRFRMPLLSFYYGFCLLKNKPEGFKEAKDLGNISIILKKIWSNRLFGSVLESEN